MAEIYDDKRIFVSCTTYKKNDALRSTLDQAIKGDLGEICGFHIADGTPDSFAEEVYEEYKNKNLPFSLHYSVDGSQGIWDNKNQGIEFFLNKTSCPYLCLIDDDCRFHRYHYPLLGKETLLEALMEAHQKTRYPHIMVYLDDYNDPLSNQAFFTTFPIISENPWTLTSNGAQGVFMFYTRLAIESVGYFRKFPTRYGAENVEHSSRINVKIGTYPELFVFLKNCHRYISVLGIPNNYEVKSPEVEKNQRFYEKIREEKTYRGLDLEVKVRPR